jgi:hypothetical protein
MKRSYSKVEVRDPNAGYDGDPPKRGLYDGKLLEVEEHESTSSEVQPNTLHWVFEITQEPYVGWRGHTYTNDSTTAWKEVQLLLSMGIVAAKDVKDGVLTKKVDLDLATLPAQAGPVRLQVVTQNYEDEKQAKLGKVLPPRESQENGESGKAGKAGKKGKKGKKVEEPF